MEIHNFLKRENLEYILGACEGNKVWSDSPLTGNTENPKFKNNKEYIGPCLEDIVRKVREDLDSNIPWRQYIIAPQASSSPLILKYGVNDHYEEHADIGKGQFDVALHFTNVLFLSDPDDYEGGEHNVDIYGTMKPHKLPLNTLLTYPTGRRHSVNPLTKGTRYVITWWTCSAITDPVDRETLRNLNLILQKVQKYLYEDLKVDFKEGARHPLGRCMVDISRMADTIHAKYPRPRPAECPLLTE